MAAPSTYIARVNIANPTASATLPAIQIAAPAAKPLEILRVEINQETSTTSGVTAVELVTSTATAPGSLGTTGLVGPNNLNPSDNATGSSTVTSSGFSGALTGTQKVYEHMGFNVLNGALYLPVPEERLRVAGGAFFWVRLPVTAPSATYNISVTYTELG